MTRHGSSYLTPRLIFGLMVMVMGVLFTLDNLDVVNIGHYWRFWPVFLIGAGLGKVMQPAGAHGRGFGAVLIGIGAWLLLYNLGVVDVGLGQLWPVLLVALGASMVWRAMDGRSHRFRPPAGPPPAPGFGEQAGAEAPPVMLPTDGAAAGTADNTVHALAILGSADRRVLSQDFRGGDLTATLGGCKIDLRNASIRSGPAVLDVFAFWGGIELAVPQDWQLVVEGTPILGGFEDKTVHPTAAAGKILVIRGLAVMGGVEIHN